MDTTLEDLTKKLNDLAMHHALELTKQKEKEGLASKGEVKVEEIATAITSLDFFNAFDKAAIKKTITLLKTSVMDLLKFSILTQSKHINKPMPLTFDALVELFTFSTEEFRKQYFNELVTLYFEELCRSLQKLDGEILNKVLYDQEVKLLLPLVKLMVASQSSQENISNIKKEPLLSNIGHYFNFPKINQEDIYQIIRTKMGSSHFKLKSFELVPLNEKNGHLGEYFQLKIMVYIKENVQQFDLFAKFLTPKTEEMKKMALAGPSKKEEFFYMMYMPLLKKYGLNSLLDFAPRCYFSRINDVLILDDMAANGFVGLTPNRQLKYDALQQVVKKMASFHAATMILEEMMSQQKGRRIMLHDRYAEFLQEVFFDPSDNYFLKPHFDVGLETMYYIASKFPELTKKFSEECLKDKIGKFWKMHFTKISKSDNLKNTMCHGDMYVSNILFKYNEENVCQDVRLIDFQILRYCPPTHDLLFFLHQSCTKEERNMYLSQLCNEYYKELSKHMENFGFDANQVYPKEDFEKSLKYMKSQAVMQAFYYSPITMISPKLREDIFSNEEQVHYYMHKHRWKLVDIGLEDNTYKTVMKGLVEDIVEMCENDN